MHPSTIQPGLLRIFRYFTAVAMAYFATLVFFTALQSGKGFSAPQKQLYLNLITNAVLFGYLSWGWLRRRLKAWYLPIALLVAILVPVFSNLFYLTEPSVIDSSMVIARSWLLFPILIIPLVLIAWQYNFFLVLVFTVLTAVLELAVLYPVVGSIDFETLPILGVPLIRAFAFGTVGHIVTHLTAAQQAQSKALLKANLKLIRHAETLEQLAVSRERNRLARELHDTMAHTLSGQAVNLEAIKMMLPPEQAETRAMLDRALEATRSGLRETRQALKDLRSQILEDLGLGLAVRNMANDAASRAEFVLEMEIDRFLPVFHPDVELCVFRIAQESMENIVRHANASQVTLRLVMAGKQLQLLICDNGVGTDLETISLDEKYGIKGMRERAMEVNGRLEVESLPGQGTSVQFLLGVPDD